MTSALERIVFLLGLAVASPLFAQTVNPPVAASHSPSMPADPITILQMAAKANGLTGPNIQPWHIKATYQTFDLNGKPQDSGTYEESWISDTKYRRSYTSASFTQTDIATGTALFRSGNQNWPDTQEESVRKELIQPIYDLGFQNLKLGKKKLSTGSARLLCVSVTSNHGSPDIGLYCFTPDQPVLRADTSPDGTNQTFFNSIVIFEGHAVAKDIQASYQGRPQLSIHVETIESMSKVNDSDFVSPSNGVEIPVGKIRVSTKALGDPRVLNVSPIYPSLARSEHVQGTVVILFTIGKDGNVIAAKAISGPPTLEPGSVDSVRQWKYQPFLILGVPVEVEAHAEVVYSIGGPPAP